MRIAIVHPSMSRPGGAEYVVAWLAAGLARRGHQVTLFTTGYSEATFGRPHEEGFHVRTLVSSNASRPVLWRSRTVWEGIVERLARELGEFDLVNPHIFPANAWVHQACVRARISAPVLWMCQEPDRYLHQEHMDPHLRHIVPALRRGGLSEAITGLRERLRGRLTRAQLCRADLDAAQAATRVLANSAFTARNVHAVYGREAHLCPLGIPVPAETPTAAPPGDRTSFLVVGSFWPQKNLDSILEAFARFREGEERTDWRLRLVGGGPAKHRARLGERIERLGLTGCVDVIDAPSLRAQVDAEYQRARAVVYVPLDEPFGLVPLEAGAWGRAVIASNHGGPAETIRNGIDGILVDPLCVPEIAAAMERIARSPGLCVALGRRLRDRVLSNYTVDHYIDRFLEHGIALAVGGRPGATDGAAP